MKFKKVSIPQGLLDDHAKEIPDKFIFYRPMYSNLFRIKYHKEMTQDFLDVIVENCIARGDMFFIHRKKIFDFMDILHAYDFHDVIFSEPDLSFIEDFNPPLN